MILHALRTSPEWSASSPGWPVPIPPLRWVLLVTGVVWLASVLTIAFLFLGVPAPLVLLVDWTLRTASAAVRGLGAVVAGLGG